jgi:hypothetical protein
MNKPFKTLLARKGAPRGMTASPIQPITMVVEVGNDYAQQCSDISNDVDDINAELSGAFGVAEEIQVTW